MRVRRRVRRPSAAGLLAGALAAGLPSASLLAQQAAPDAPCPGGSVALAGTVADPVTGEGVAGAEVRAVRDGESPMFWTARTGSDGTYRLCVPRDDRPVRLRASYGRKSGGEVALAPSAHRSGVYLEVPLTEAQDLVGVVFDEVWRRPVPAAVITLEPLGVRVFSDEAGRFRFAELPEGSYDVRVEAQGYRPFESGVLVRDLGQGAERIRVTLQPEVYELEPLTVEVERRSAYLRDSGMYERMDGERGGLFLTEELLAQPVWWAASVSDVLEQSWDAARRIRRCSSVWVDGRRAEVSAFDLGTTTTRDVLAIEVLGPGEAPLRYHRDTLDTTSCGVVLVWTKWGAERWRERRFRR